MVRLCVYTFTTEFQVTEQQSTGQSPGEAHRRGRPTLEEASAIPARIIAAASELFLDLGFESATMELIAQQAHVSKRTLYDRFHSKEEVFLASVEAMSARKRAELDGLRVTSRTLRNALVELTNKLIEIVATPELVAFERMIAAEQRRFPDLAERRLRTGRERILRFVELVMRKYAPYSQMSTQQVAHYADLFVSMVALPQVRQSLLPDDIGFGSGARDLESCIDIFIRGTADGVAGGASLPANHVTGAVPRHRRGGARSRILAAAVERFSSASYEDTSLREIAADAKVDVAYVHRSFGSKEALFREALDAASRGDELATICSSPQLARSIASMYATRHNRPGGHSPLDIMIHSLGSPTAVAALKRKLMSDLVTPLSGRLAPPGELRAIMISSLLIGVGMSASILQMPALLGDDSSVEALLEGVVETIMTRKLA